MKETIKDATGFLKDKTFYIATVENNKPIIRPFGAVMEFEDKLYFVTSKQKNVYRQILDNPNISICACDENRQWLRISGVARQDESIAAKQRMLNDNPVLIERKRYTSANDETMAIFCLENITIEWN